MKTLKFSPATVMLGLGLVFLYLPLAVVVIYSFNASKLVTVWTGFSTEWYGELLADRQILAAARNSLIVALLSATLATIIGTCAGYALARFRRFRGRAVLAGSLAAPLVLPEVIAGISLLLLFVAFDLARGVLTLVIAHASFTLCYVAVIVQARLAGMARDTEEAAADLGAKPFAVFFHVTLPALRPALISGWLLAFILSLDDLVISSFVSGPQSTTLPMVVFSSIRLGVSPKINALATIIIVATLAILALAAWTGRKALRQKS